VEGELSQISTTFPTTSGGGETQPDQHFSIFSTEKWAGYYEYLY